MKEYKEQQEENKVEEVVIKVVSAAWCGSCGSYKESLKQNNIEYTLIDADDFNNQEYISKLGIRGLPCTILEVDAVVKAKIQGLVSIASLRKAIDDILAEAKEETNKMEEK